MTEENEKTYEKVVEKLEENIPANVVSKRKGSNGKELSYLEGWYVQARLNKVIGQGLWSTQVKRLEKTFEGSCTNAKGQQGRIVSYAAVVILMVNLPGNIVTSFEDVGNGTGRDYNSGAEADESAMKEAVTDALKRCAKALGNSMGLGLYDKSGAGIGEEETQTEQSKPSKANGKKKPSEDADAEAARAAITNAALVLQEKAIMTTTDFKTKYLTKHKVDQLGAASPEILTKILTEVREKHADLFN